MYYWTDYLHVSNSGCCQITSAASERALHEAGSTNKNFYSSSATGELPTVTEKPSHNPRWSNKGFDAGKSLQRWTTLTWSSEPCHGDSMVGWLSKHLQRVVRSPQVTNRASKRDGLSCSLINYLSMQVLGLRWSSERTVKFFCANDGALGLIRYHHNESRRYAPARKSHRVF